MKLPKTLNYSRYSWSKGAGSELERFLMPSRAEYDRFETVEGGRGSRPPDPRRHKPRQEICAPLKWTCFILNFIVFLLGVTCLALGVYLCIKDPRSISEWADIILNPAIMLIIIGLAICIVSLCGAFGALRDNVFLLKTFALCVFFSYVVLVICTFVVFMLFYSDTTEGLSAHSILLYSIKRYHTNRNLADFVDYIQEQLECCGASSMSQGYRDWQLSEQFQCETTNPYPEKCGVPFSCCKRAVVSEAAGSSNPLLPAMRSLQCWQNAQTKRVQDLEQDLHTRGCLQPLRTLFESHAVHIGIVVAVVILPVCVSVCLSHVLAKQIDHQRYLLEREARRYEKRKRRERERQRQRDLEIAEAMASASNDKSRPLPAKPVATTVDETAKAQDGAPRRKEERGRRKKRSASSSPNRGVPKGEQNIPAEKDKPLVKKKERRRKRSVNSQSTPPAIPPAENRTHQWVLQQSDLVNKHPVA
uniref:Tetraspanin n=1 Tax=Steinernema glaseri TaxID=37863 RepID=A0A1I8A3V8_9BILA